MYGMFGNIDLSEYIKPTESSGSTCKRCGARVDLEPSEHFATYCGPDCLPAPPYGPLKKLPDSYKNR